MSTGARAGTAARTALVTGAGRGLGRELVRQLAAAGWRVIACARRPEQVADTAGGDVLALPLDLADPALIAALAAGLAGERIDLLIHNAAIRGDTGGLARFDAADFAEVMAVNVAGPLALTAALLRRMPSDGKVAFISSRAGSMAEGRDPDGDYAYCCSKAALNRAAVKLADDFPQCFLTLHPGWVRTDMGGDGATVDPTASAAGLLRVIAAAGSQDSGKFLTWEGETVAW